MKRFLQVLLGIFLIGGGIFYLYWNQLGDSEADVSGDSSAVVSVSSSPEAVVSASPSATLSEDLVSTTPVPDVSAKVTDAPSPKKSDGHLFVHMMNVGQGLGILLESDGHFMLYDGGNWKYYKRVVRYLQKQGITSLDYVIASHYDADHASGLVGAIRNFDVETVMAPDYSVDTSVYKEFAQAVKKKGLSVTHPKVGKKFSLGSAVFTVLAPIDSSYSAENDYSIVIRVVSGDSSVLITGDASTFSEKEMLDRGEDLSSDILVVGHHGSSGSTSEEFLEAVHPNVAFVSCKPSNEYAFPSQDVMERLEKASVSVFRTDRQGAISATSDGTSFHYSKEPCNDYTPGISEPGEEALALASKGPITYVLNTNTHKFHLSSCAKAPDSSTKSYATSTKSRDQLISEGFYPCHVCKP